MSNLRVKPIVSGIAAGTFALFLGASQTATAAEALTGTTADKVTTTEVAAGSLVRCEYFGIHGTDIHINCVSSVINANSRVFMSIGEFDPFTGVSAIGNPGTLTIHKVSPEEGQVDFEIDAIHGAPLNVRIDLLVINP